MATNSKSQCKPGAKDNTPKKGNNWSPKGNKGGRNRRRNNKRDNVRPEAMYDQNGPEQTANDPAWYTNGPGGAVPFNLDFHDRVGGPYYFDLEENNGIFAVDPDVPSIPGIMSLNFLPHYGEMGVVDDPLNLATQEMVTALRYAKSYSSTYTASWLGKYLIMADQVSMIHAMNLRIAGMMNWFSTVNQYYPEAVYTAMGLTHNSFSGANRDRFIGWANQFAKKAELFKVPNLNVYDRHRFLCENIFSDAVGVQSQLFVFRPQCLYIYRVTDTNSYLELTQCPWTTGTTVSLDQYVTYCNQIINSMVFDTDMTIVAADMLRYYGDSQLRHFEMMTYDYESQPVFNPVVCTQIHNMTIAPLYSSTRYPNSTPSNGWNIETNPNTGMLLSRPMIDVTDEPNAFNLFMTQVLDSQDGSVSPDFVAEATRLKCMVMPITATNKTQFKLIAGTEIVTEARVYWYRYVGTSRNLGQIVLNVNNAQTWGLYAAKFANAPIVPIVNTVDIEGVKKVTLLGWVGDFNLLTYVTRRMLSQMFETSAFSIYKVPALVNIKAVVPK